MFEGLFKQENGLAMVVAIAGIAAVIAGGLASMGAGPGQCIATVESNKLPLAGMLGGLPAFVNCPNVVAGPLYGSTNEFVDFITHPQGIAVIEGWISG